jgi:hypothetical protein
MDIEQGRLYGMHVQGPYQVFSCYNPLVTDPLHYYTHTVVKSDPNKILLQEFSLDLGNKSILFCNDLHLQKTIIKMAHDAEPLVLNFIIEPDFPYLTSLRKKVRTAITFS